MKEYIDYLNKMVLSSDIEQSVKGVELIVKLIDEVTNSLLKALESSGDQFITAEKLSVAFDGYISKLKEYLTRKEMGMDFWAASLIMNYQINDSNAENILLSAIQFSDDVDKSSTAATILCRVKNQKVKNVISLKLKDQSLGENQRRFFQEKLNNLEF